MATSDDLLTKDQPAAVCGVTVRTLSRYSSADDPLPPVLPSGHGKPTLYDPATVGAWLIRRELMKLQEQTGSSDPIDYHAERVQADHQELRNSGLRRELSRVELVQFALADVCAQISATLGTIKGKVKRAQPSLSNQALHEIDQLVVACQNAAADCRIDWTDAPDGDE